MASSAQSNTKKDEKPAAASSTEAKPEQQKPAAALEEDDEFEDFPVEGRISLAVSRSNSCAVVTQARQAARSSQLLLRSPKAKASRPELC
jgi:hypothetical protein